MADFTEPTPVTQESTVPTIQKFNELSVGAGSSRITMKKGRLEIRDTDGNIVILLDANG